MMTDSSVLAEWRARLEDRARSGLTIEQWCVQHQMTVRRFRYWRKKVNAQSAAPAASNAKAAPKARWLAVEVSPEQTPGLTVRVGAAAVEVARGFDAALLRDIVAALGLAPC